MSIMQRYKGKDGFYMKEYFAYQWHITDYCDQRCKHCYIFSENKDIKLLETPFNQVVKTLNSIEEMCQKENKNSCKYGNPPAKLHSPVGTYICHVIRNIYRHVNHDIFHPDFKYKC